MQYAYLVCVRIYLGIAATWFVHLECFSYCLMAECQPGHLSEILLNFLKIIITAIISLVINY